MTDGTSILPSRFAFQLLAELFQKQPPENHFVSPVGIALALTLLLEGAGGDTRAAVNQALRFTDGDPENSGQRAEELRLLLRSHVEGIETRAACSLWSRSDLPLSKPFTDQARQRQIADLGVLSEGSEGAINRWVSDYTKGRIKQVVSAENINEDTCLLLLSAIYFKGIWSEQFDKSLTKPAPFYLTAETCIDHPMMRLESSWAYH